MPQFLVGHAEAYDANWYNEEREFGLPRMHMAGDRELSGHLLRGFALLARAAGLLGHLAEERRNPIGMDVYLTVDRNAVYED